MNKKITYLCLIVFAIVIILSGVSITELKYYVPLSVSLIFWFATVYSVKKKMIWTGPLLFALSWFCFSLLQVVNEHWVIWHADDLLITIDNHIWGGKVLPAYFHYENHPWLTDFFCLCYFCFYFIVLGGVIYYARKGNHPTSIAFFNGLMASYLVGYIGYFCLPAAGPAFYHLPDTGIGGHAISRFLIDIVKQGVTGMDAFPSLHTAKTIYVVACFYRDGLTKTAILLTPIAIGIVGATIFLRYHYGIDVIAGILLTSVLLWKFSPPIVYRKMRA